MSRACNSAPPRSEKTLAKWTRARIPGCRADADASTGDTLGSAIVPRKNRVHTSAASNGSAQPASNARTQVRGVTDRRRLSTIFQRPLAGIFAGMCRVFPRSALQPRIQGSNCQSPRAQRW